MKEAAVATVWFVVVGILSAMVVGSWQSNAPPDVKFAAFICLWAVTGALPPAFYKLMREWFR